ncbi:autotransporter-associated beta strand repeat-containing protein [Ancylobacter vacuolatus]|uniref:Autotransporter-associated beta strand protein/T5SS/PEP-CTERM-associated repeat protein n=1 Tax=Ancylobacter vacuolatus TaxID=223389 RepID=A0ABU0DCC7_9HYPH|nr:autotransporter-associated beta strand repeat-containing protein [Ancylobacter vacuolatus]MDQ0346049.1 autotransporter-associated beta strand protein/T5SS/PEP-CTERM-associated repeat protein [Ancylobacter vacuolatus]
MPAARAYTINDTTETVPGTHASPWDLGTQDIIIGNTGTGALTVESGGVVKNRETHVGEKSGSTGTLTVTGDGSSLSGGTQIEAGILKVAADDNLGADTGGLDFSGGALATTASFTSARNVSLADPGGTIDTASATSLILSGAVTGTGGLTKEGDGTLILTGTNSSRGTTTINAGTLQIGNGGATGSITGHVVNNASLVFNRSGTYSFPGTLTGSGTVSLLGSGTVLFADPGAYSGAIHVSGSTVHLENQTQSGSVFTLDEGAILNGTGTIGGLQANSGSRVSPGNSPGTLIRVNGVVAFNASSIYRVDVTPAGAYDLISAGGAVTLSSGASV